MLRLLLLCLLAAPARAEPDTAAFSGPVRVIDGDTFDVAGTRVRLHGIDAAEDDQTCEIGGATWRCGAWVTGRVRDLFEGRTASCDPVETDRYGRTVARCSVEAMGDAKDAGVRVDLGAEIVGRGLAVAYRAYSMDYVDVEAAARAKGVGVFAGAMEDPAAHRAAARASGPGREPPDPACPIKGNISGNGHIYHPPGGRFYARTSIDEDRGERWFCTPAEAIAAGWRAARG